MAIIDVDSDAAVYCRGQRCGKLRGFITDEEKGRITNLIVELKDQPERQYILPVALTEATNDRRVYLIISGEELRTYPEFKREIIEALHEAS